MKDDDWDLYARYVMFCAPFESPNNMSSNPMSTNRVREAVMEPPSVTVRGVGVGLL